ncbi:hypothetical protein [Pseudomonas palmensis]
MKETPECSSPVKREFDEVHAGALPQIGDRLMTNAGRSTAS